MPMLTFGRAPQDVSRVKLELWPAFHLRPADTFGNDQRLARRVRMPCSAGAGLKVDDRASYPQRIRSLELAGDGYLASEIFRRSFDRLHFQFCG